MTEMMMNEEKITELLFDINGKLSGIRTQLDTLSETILKHESRLTSIESKLNDHLIECASEGKEGKEGKDDDFKTEMLRLLGKCLLIALTSIGSLVGAASLIAKIIGS